MFIVHKHLINLCIVLFVSYLIICATTSGGIILVNSKGSIKAYKLASDGIKSVIKQEITEYDINGDPAKGKKILKKIKKLVKSSKKLSLIMTIGLTATKLIKGELNNVPLIFSMVINPEKNGLTGIKQLGGVSFDLSPESQFSRLQKIAPSARNIGVIYDDKNSGNIIEIAKKSASNLGFTLIDKKISSKKKVPDAIEALIGKIDILWLILDNTVVNIESFKFINTKTLENQIPVMACSPQLVKMGSSFCFFSTEFSVGRQAALICQKVMDGEIKEDIPVESPKNIFMAINKVAMKKCGIKLHQDVINSAKEVY